MLLSVILGVLLGVVGLTGLVAATVGFLAWAHKPDHCD